jgi:AraC-like DNA-binding protein
MSEALLLTGKRGQGKTLYALERIRRYMMAGRMVATNLDLNIDKIVSPINTVRAFRLPDHPTERDLVALPLGNPNPRNEKMNGLLVLDEASTFLNSRSWDTDKKGRLKVIGWLAQSRKFGWDLILIAQHANMIDSQIRESLFEHFGVCVNLQGLMIPFFTKISGGVVRFPKIHRVAIRLGFHPKAPLVEHDFFKGADLFDCYDTLQVINPDVGVPSGAGYFYLSAFDLKGRFMSRWQRMKRIVCVTALSAFFCGFVLSEIRHFFKPVHAVSSVNAAPVEESKEKTDESISAYGLLNVGGVKRVLLSDGRNAVVSSVRRRSDGTVEYESDGVWYRGR